MRQGQAETEMIESRVREVSHFPPPDCSHTL
jgi:hypothetical protein